MNEQGEKRRALADAADALLAAKKIFEHAYGKVTDNPDDKDWRNLLDKLD